MLYRLVERDQVCIVLAELVGELKKFLGVAREPRELGEDEARDAAFAHVRHHALRFGMVCDPFPGHAFEVIYLAHVPSLGLGIEARALLMHGRTVSPRLVFG